MEIPRIHVHDDGVQTIGADQVFNIGTNQVFIRDIPRWLVAVSYTHLTLPTITEV